ncbi:hypothetical protein F7R05_14115 [Pseudomonas koreensis]|nr:hypothetical protein F7R05_14115 [Pseudomonas koreensis]
MKILSKAPRPSKNSRYLWRGSLLPPGRAAALSLPNSSRPAAQSSGSKLPRHSESSRSVSI